jgi:aarF domain-containing kinase
MGALFSAVRTKKLSEIEVGEFLSEILRLTREFHVKLEGNFATLVMGTIVLEGLGRHLNPQLNFLEAAVPFLFPKASLELQMDMIKSWFRRTYHHIKIAIEPS